MGLDQEAVARFITDGYVLVRAAVDPGDVVDCQSVIAQKLLQRAVDLSDPSTWNEPVVRIPCPETPEFAKAGTSTSLWQVYDQLLGSGRHVERRGVGGTIPVRFPSDVDPGDAGWHFDGSYDVNGAWWANVHSRVRGLLALFLFSDVAEQDAATEILIGSHLDVPRLLAPYGEAGCHPDQVKRQLPASTFKRSSAYATGKAGDVYVCHPFLIHRATWPHRGNGPRILAQPEIRTRQPFALKNEGKVCPVEQAIVLGLRH